MARIKSEDFWSQLRLQEDSIEDTYTEFKLAAGKDGKGALPSSFFETYSAMANTQGGLVVLGIKEKPIGTFHVQGVSSPARVVKSLWDQLNDQSKVSINLLSNTDVAIHELDGKKVIVIEIPRASRSQRPVYIGQNPLTGTYRRNFEGDYKCDQETVKRMLSEQIGPERDGNVLAGYSFMEDIELETFRSYRKQFLARSPEHVWNELDDIEFLRSIGGSSKDRESGKTGLTLAGLLMFGKLPSILDAVPNYTVDYQERSEARADKRWLDRVTTDGRWSGNLFDFYRIVIKKLVDNLKVPFELKGDVRVDNSPVHEAIREAFVNTLIHADYSNRVSVFIVKRPDLFGFRNPGGMRISIKDALKGGMSDCRNRRLQKMFQLVGLGEQAGSGIPKIWQNWDSQHWRTPDLIEQQLPEQTILALRMVSFIPEAVMNQLNERFGTKLGEFNNVQRLALATIIIEGCVSHARLRSMTTDHSSDISRALYALVKDSYITSVGAAKGTIYYFPEDAKSAGYERLFDFSSNSSHSKSSEHLDPNSEHLELNSEHTDLSSEHLDLNSEHTDLSSEQTDLMLIAKGIRESTKTSRETVRKTILQLCAKRQLSIKELSVLLGRKADTLRVHYLNDMIKENLLRYKFQAATNHPKQAYYTNQEEAEKLNLLDVPKKKSRL